MPRTDQLVEGKQKQKYHIMKFSNGLLLLF